MKKEYIITGIAAILVLLLTIYGLGWRRGRRTAISGIKPQVDTFIRYVPVRSHDAPVVAETKLATLPYLVFLHDNSDTTVTDAPKDSAALVIEQVQRVQEDTSGLYTAYVSGPKLGSHGPKLDSITINVPERTIYVDHIREVTKKARWGIGLQVGYGLTADFNPSPYVGIGITYNIFSW